jgi:hypothetical protein
MVKSTGIVSVFAGPTTVILPSRVPCVTPAGFAVTVRVLGAVPAVGLTESQPDSKSSVVAFAENAATPELVSRSMVLVVGAPAGMKNERRVVGEVINGSLVTFIVTLTTVGIAFCADGVRVSVAVYTPGESPAGETLTFSLEVSPQNSSQLVPARGVAESHSSPESVTVNSSGSVA